MQFLEKLKPLGLLVLRWAVGASFLYHGYPKLSDPARWLKAFPAMGFPSYFAYISGILEVFGGGLLILGLFTRGAALLLAIEMGVAIWKVHSGGGFMAVRNYEFPLALLVACFALASIGAGR